MKIHLKNTNKGVLIAYARSPHIYNSFKSGDLSLCMIIAQGYTTDDIQEVTCQRCLNMFEGKPPTATKESVV